MVTGYGRSFSSRSTDQNTNSLFHTKIQTAVEATPIASYNTSWYMYRVASVPGTVTIHGYWLATYRNPSHIGIQLIMLDTNLQYLGQ